MAAPETPRRSLARQSLDSNQETPPSHYFLASEETPTKPGVGTQISIERTPQALVVDEPDQPGSSSSYESGTTGTSFGDESMMEVDDGNDDDEALIFDQDEEGEDAGIEDEAPLVGRRSKKRKRRWEEGEKRQKQGLLELIPPLILAHPLPLLPLLSLLPYNFLPAGVIFFIPVLCVLAVLSACAHIVIVYLCWYLKVSTFEDVFAAVTGARGKYGLWGGRVAIVTSVIGLVVSWIGTLHPLMQPAIETYLPDNDFLRSRITWTIFLSIPLLPSLLPSRMTRNLRRAPILLALLLPIVSFLVIGRTVEIKKAAEENGTDAFRMAERVVKREFGLAGGSSAGAGITTLTIFLSPHINTSSIHSGLDRNKRSGFPMPCLITGVIILALGLPLALVPYYLLPPLDSQPSTTPTTPSGVFAHLPVDDGWLNLARALMCIIALGTCNMWILRGRDTILRAMGVERGERQKAGRWVGLVIWVVVVAFACIGGIVAEKLELLGVMAVLAVSWFLPSLFFIITFHVRSPLAIVFPSKHPPTEAEISRSTHSRTNSTNDPSTDVLLARKERQLQKRRLGRRLWQDLIVYVGILPVGGLTLLWTFGALIGVW